MPSHCFQGALHNVVASLPVFGVAGAICAGASAQQVSSVWIGGPNGSNLDPMWSPHSPPYNTSTFLVNLLIDANPNQASTIEFGGEFTLFTLTVSSGDKFRIGGSVAINGGSVANDGNIKLLEQSHLVLNGNTTLSGSGSLTGQTDPQNKVYGSLSVYRLTNGPSHTINGTLQLGHNSMLLTNQGIIEATYPDAAITIDLSATDPNYNSGIIRSTIGNLVLKGSSIDNSNGLIEVGAGTTLTIDSSGITGGVLRDADGSGPGLMQTTGFALLRDIKILGLLRIGAGSTTQLGGVVEFDAGLLGSAPPAGNAYQVLSPGASLSGSGDIDVGAVALTSITSQSGLNTLTLGPSIRLHGACKLGQGQLYLANAGIVESDTLAGMVIKLTSGPGNSNTGALRASTGSTLTLQDCALDNAGGVVDALAASTVVLSNMSLKGGTLRAAPGAAEVRNANAVTLENVTLEGLFNAVHASTTTAAGAVTVAGELRLSAQATPPNTFTSLVLQNEEFTLQGSGVTRLMDGNNARIKSDSQACHLTVGAQHTVKGAGRIGTGLLPLTNLGTIDSDTGLGLTINPGASFQFDNQGTLRASAAPLKLTTGSFTNSGRVLIEAGQTLQRTGTVVQTAGETRVMGSLSATGAVTVTGGTVGGTGQMSTTTCNMQGGALAPGDADGDHTGTFTLNGALALAPLAAVNLELGGAQAGTECDKLHVNGNVTLAGTLELVLVDGFIPSAKQTIELATWTGSVSGGFDRVVSPIPVLLTVNANSLTATFQPQSSPPADLNSDGAVDGADLGMLLAAWGSCASCPADLNGDGSVDGADLGMLLASWG